MKRKNCMKRKYMFMALLCYALTTAAAGCQPQLCAYP